MSASDAAKKAQEKAVLDNALGHCRHIGGYRKKQAAKLAGEIDSEYERPDLAIVRENGSVIGLEHFRVDHHVDKSNAVASKTTKLSSYLEKQRKALLGTHNGEQEDQLLTEFAKILANGAAKHMQNHNAACCDDLARSLDKRLFDEKTGHAQKLPAYKENLATRYGAATEIELGYLIEVHSDFNGLFLTQNRETKRLAAGECPLFENAYDLLEQAAKEADWILIAFYPLVGNNLADAAIIDCRNGMFGKSCIRQGFSRTAYLGLGKSAPYRKQPKPGETHVELAGDNYELSIENNAEALDQVSLWSSGIKGAASALTLRRQGKPFAATLPVQMLYETLLPESNRVRGKITSKTALELLTKMPSDRRMRYLESFGDKYDISPDVQRE